MPTNVDHIKEELEYSRVGIDYNMSLHTRLLSQLCVIKIELLKLLVMFGRLIIN